MRSPFKERLVQLLGMWSSEGLQLSGPLGIASVAENCPVQGHSPSQGSSHPVNKQYGGIKAWPSQFSLVQLWMGSPAPEFPEGLAKAVAGSAVLLTPPSAHSCFLPFQSECLLPGKPNLWQDLRRYSAQERIISFRSFSSQHQNPF